MRRLVLLSALVLAGCSGVPPKAEDLSGPSARLMAAPKPLPDVAEGADLYQENVACTAKLSLEQGRIRGLQRYARTVTRKD